MNRDYLKRMLLGDVNFQDDIWNNFTYFFREIKGHYDWTDEQIGGSINNDDIDEFIYCIKEVLNYDYNRD